MHKLIIHGDPGIRRGAIIEHADEEVVCFSIDRQGDWHGPEEVQLWCTVGTEEERDTFQQRNYVPHFLDVEAVDADAVSVVKSRGDRL